MSAHTPGPWRVGKFGAVYDSKGFEVADPQQGPFLHESHDGNHGHWATTEGAHVEREDEEMESNSRLIAAAPDLLAALVGLTTQPIAKAGWSKSWDDAMDAARVAIAKAEGKS